MSNQRLTDLFDVTGQSPWLDNLKREYIVNGDFARVLASGIRGLTSNPTIFQKAIQGSSMYDEQFNLAAGEDREKAAIRFVPRQSFIGGGSA